MTTGRYSRRNASFRPTGVRRSDRENNFFLAIVGFSLLSHIIVAALFLYTPPTTSKRRPPTLYVDLVMAPPVANPQRGSAGATVKTAAPAVTIPQPTVAPTKVAKPPVVVKEKETKKAAVVKEDVDIAADIARMKQRKAAQDEQREIQAAIAAMKQKTTSTPPAATTVGSASGTGDEAGGDINKWIYEEFRAKWKLSKYQIKNPNLTVSLTIEYDKNGSLIKSDFEWSGDRTFDDSIRNAFDKFSKEKLPTTYLAGMRKNFETQIILNPNELFKK